MTLILLSLIMVIKLKAMVPIKICGACNIPKLRLCIPHEGGHDVFATNQLFQFWAKKIGTQRCAKILLTINITLQYNSHCVESE